MPYACHKCGSTIEDGTAFCPHCGAPQIRVALPENDSPPFIPGTPAEMQPPAEPVPLRSVSLPNFQGMINWRDAFPALSIAGLSTGLAAWLPLQFLWILGGGVLAVILYRKRHRDSWGLTPKTGAKLGAVAGLIGYLIFTVMAAVDFTRPHSAVREAIVTAFQQAAARNPDPATQEMYHKMLGPEGMALMVTMLMAVLFVFFLGLAAIGGAIGASVSRRERS